MPGYQWTVHKVRWPGDWLKATGIQTSGSNRLSTLMVVIKAENGIDFYEVKSSGYGVRAPWLHTTRGGTLAQALRHLQTHYEGMAQKYKNHAEYMQKGRTA